MNEFIEILGKINEQDSPEDALEQKIEDEIKTFIDHLRDEFWFHEDAEYGGLDVLDWLKENKHEFYEKVLEQPETLEGSDFIGVALKALGLMKPWIELGEEDLQTPEDIENWKIATGYYKED